MKFSVTFDNYSSSASADTLQTAAAIIAGDTAGYRCRIRSITVGPADDSPADLNLSIQLKRIEDYSAGGAGTAGSNPTPVPKDSLSRASVCTAGIEYSGEPTAYGDAFWETEISRRNTVIKEWSVEDAPICNRDQVIGLLIAPRTAAAAVISGTIEFEEF